MRKYSFAITLGAASLLLAGSAFAQHGGRGMTTTMPTIAAPHISQTTTHLSQGSTHGTGWNHSTGPTHPLGQPSASCGSASAPFTPGNAAAAPGSAFDPTGKAGTVYAGQQPQNSRNTASVAQYDAACSHQK